MAETLERLVAIIEADARGFRKDIAEARRIFDRESIAIERRQAAMTSRINAGFIGLANGGIQTLIGRYLRLSAIIIATQRVMRESIASNDEAARAWARVEEAFSRLAGTLGPEVAAVLNTIAFAFEKAAQGAEFLHEQIGNIMNALRPGVGFPSANVTIPMTPHPFYQSATFNKSLGNWTPGPAGFPEPGVRDVTPRRQTGRTVAERERDIYLDTMRALEDLINTRFEADAQFRRMQGEEAQDLRNRSPIATNPLTGLTQAEMDGIEDFWARAAEAENAYWERVTNERVAEQDLVAERIYEIGDAFEFLAGAALQGADAFERAILSMVQSLAASGLRRLFEAGLASLVDGGGFVGNLIAGRAAGGPVSAGTPYIVGERGPELFVPRMSGAIIPNIPSAAAVGGGSINLTLHQHMSLAANGDAHVAAIAQRAAAEGAAAAVNHVQRNFKSMLIRTQRNQM